MDLSIYTLEDLFLAGIKSEVDAQAMYTTLADRSKNAFLKERLLFLAGEEEKHQKGLEGMYKENFPEKELALPDKSPVPLPEVDISDPMVPMSQVLEDAMKAEKAAHDFYVHLSTKFDNPNIKMALLYFSTMEMGHYTLLEAEEENARQFEDFEDAWPLMHAGP